MFLVKGLSAVKGITEESRDILTKNADLEHVGVIQSTLDNLDVVIERLSHAETGYTAYDYSISVKEDALNRLYDYDNSLFAAIGELRECASRIKA